ncbi:hypothetical protein H7347_05380 [Corynebacterium sp. zg-331]|uniref:DUF6541 family protein n=1 Tax=unclassified Corynebacterium TaxID=2624378 RepID=UPI00128B389C|nr:MULTISPECIES: DUF6541 family protein [unclassified Corynebacterium]MBC3186009.1 hypothetical protein [Corynebacterium sp. zg-331]MPV52500.1 hypothetical protein [Corynebacterium sp. zg331]
MDTAQIAYLAVLIFTLPGFLLSWASGLKVPWAVVASVPVSFGVFGLAAWLMGVTPWRYDLLSVSGLWIVLLLLALGWRYCYGRRRGGRRRRAALWTRRRDRGRNMAATVIYLKPDADILGDAAAVDLATGLAARPTVYKEALDPAAPHREESLEDTGPRWTQREWWRDAHRRRGSIVDAAWIIPALGVVAGAHVIVGKSLGFIARAPEGLNNVFQGWDVQWHANVVRWIMESGVASPTRMGELHNIETQASMFYPSGWHAGTYFIAQLGGVSPIEAVNVASAVIPGVGFPLSVGLLAWKMMRSRGLTAQLGAALAGFMIFGAPAGYWVGNYVGAWPYVAAVSLTGVVIALFMNVPDDPRSGLAAALALMGVTQMHPSAATIIVSALLLWWLCWLIWVPSRPAEGLWQGIRVRLRDGGVLGAFGAVGVVLLLPQLLVGSEVTEEVAAFSGEEDISSGQAWAKVLWMNTRHVDAFGEITLAWVLWAALIGGIALIVWRRNLWAPLLYLFSVVLAVNALYPLGGAWGEILSAIGGLHYSMAHRLVIPVAMLVMAAAGIGVATLLRLVCLAPVKKWGRASAIVSIALALPVGGGIYANLWSQIAEGAEWAINSSREDDRMVSAVDLRAFDWLARQPHAYEGLIMGEPADGHSWMYAYNSLPTVMRHYDWPADSKDSATRLLYWWPNALGAGNPGAPNERNNVDEAAERMGVKYIMISPENFWISQPRNERMMDGLWYTPGVTLVYLEDNVAIFAVNEAFTDEELEAMREPGNSPESLDERYPIPTKGEAGVAASPEEESQPYFHRPTEPNNRPDVPDADEDAENDASWPVAGRFTEGGAPVRTE